MPSFFQNLLKKSSDELDPPVAEEIRTDTIEPNRLLSAMNLPSPFAVSSEEQFTVRELSMLIPQHFVRQDAMPGDQPVALPISDLIASLKQGRPALRLSQIFMACPRLFTRQILPAEDMEILLPFQKVKRMTDAGETPVAASPFAALSPPPAGRTDSPFAPQGSPFTNGPPAQPPMPSPFAAARAANESPFAVRTPDSAGDEEILTPGSAAILPQSMPGAMSNPFQQSAPPTAPAQQPVPSPFHLVSAANPPPPPAPSPFLHATGQGNGDNPAGNQEPDSPQLDNSHEALPLANPFGTAGVVPTFPAPAMLPRLPAQSQMLPPSEPPVPSTPPAQEQSSAPSPQGRIRVSLASLLRDVTAEDLGFDPVAVPGNVHAELFYDTILPQLATGRVEVSIEELRQGVAERFRPAFARVRTGMRFVVPLSEIFQNLPASAMPAPQAVDHVAISTTPFQTPFAIKAEEDRTRATLPALSHMMPPHTAIESPLAPFPLAPSIEPQKPTPAPVVTLPKLATQPVAPAPAAATIPPTPVELPKLPDLSGMAGRPSPFARPPVLQTASPAAAPPTPPLAQAPHATLPPMPSTESHDDLGFPFSAASLQTPAPPAPASFDPTKLFTGVTPPVTVAQTLPATPTPPPSAPAASPAPPIEFRFGEAIDYNQTLLRGFFSSANDLTPHEIVDHCAQLPGLRSCLAIMSGSSIASGHGSGSDDVAHFTANAPRAFEYLTGLAESMNFEGNGSFTLRAGATVRTFIIESGVCLAVLHEKSAFAPGVREKLILTARALADMMD